MSDTDTDRTDDATSDPALAGMGLQVVVDCAEPHALAAWWAATLGWEVEPQDEDFIRRMIDEGHASQDDTTTFDGAMVWREGCAVVAPSDDGRPRLLFQQVPEDKRGKNRVHLDLRPGPDADVEQLRERLVDRGATRIGEGRQGPHTWTVFGDPEGNEFCV